MKEDHVGIFGVRLVEHIPDAAMVLMINLALQRMGFGGGCMTAHGFRAMASTLLNETGKWIADAIERQLGHVDANSVRRVYTRGKHWEERIRMMQAWSDQLDVMRIASCERARQKPAA
jgi:integrase